MEKKETVEKFFDDVVKTVKVGFDKVVAKTDQLTHMGRLKMDIMSINRDIEKKYTELGTRVFLLIAKGNNTSVNEDNQVKSCIEKIEELEERLALKKDEYDHVARSEAQTAETHEAATATDDAPKHKSASAEEAAAGVEADADEVVEKQK